MFSRLQGLTVAGWLALAGAANAAAEPAVDVTLAADGRTVSVSAPGLPAWRGCYAATTAADGGQWQQLFSTNGAAGPVTQVTEATPYGPADLAAVTVRFEQPQLELLFRFGRTPGRPGVLAQAGLRNSGRGPVRLLALTPLLLAGQVAGPPAEWLITALDQSVKQGPAVVALDELRAPYGVHESGGCYRPDGAGFLFGPVGTPIAYLDGRFQHGGQGWVTFQCAADMSGVQVEPGETRWGQQVALLLEPPRPALARWAEWVARTHGARTGRRALAGWNSWYFHGVDVTGRDVLKEVAAVRQAPDRLRPMVMQIDAGYQDVTGRKETNEKFPEGLAFYAQRIAATGARPGLFLNFQGPPGAAHIVQRAREAVRKGFTYLKINITGFSVPPAVVPRKTSFEVLRETFGALRAAVGGETYLLYNESRPNRATVGLVDANRTGTSSMRNALQPAITDALRSYQLQGRWFAVDNDIYYMGTDIANVSEIAGGWPLVRTWMSMVGLSCGAAITGDPWYWESFQPYWRNVEVMTPPADERTEVLDLCTRRDWPRLVSHVHRPWGDTVIALLWNPGAAERTVTLDFAQIGMDPHHRQAVWSFWDNRYLGVARGAWSTPALAASAAQHLCFTDLDRTPDRPVVIGSNLHIYCGAAELQSVLSRRDALTIELNDAGARAGSLFVYSRLPLTLKTVTGCAVTGIAPAGEYVWRIGLTNRQCGRPQRLQLDVLLPLAQQRWFWLLLAGLVGSLPFLWWWYLASQRLRREHALAQERIRIARDLHDDIGAGLTEIALLSEVVRQDGGRAEAVNANLRRIFESVSEMTQALDEIVWAVNPANDTLDKLIAFLGEYAQAILEPAGLRCRLDMPLPAPELALNSKIRHQLCMAVKACLHNVIKHARAREVALRLERARPVLTLTVADDGVGFDPDALQDRAGTHDGLANLRRRLAEIDGVAVIESAPGRGTRVRLQVTMRSAS